MAFNFSVGPRSSLLTQPTFLSYQLFGGSETEDGSQVRRGLRVGSPPNSHIALPTPLRAERLCCLILPTQDRGEDTPHPLLTEPSFLISIMGGGGWEWRLDGLQVPLEAESVLARSRGKKSPTLR